MEDTIKFRTTIMEMGGSQGIVLAKQIREYLELNKGDEVEISPQKGKHGKYIAIWKKEPQTPP